MYNWSFGAGDNECAWVHGLLRDHVLGKKPLPSLAPEAVLILLRVTGKWRNNMDEANQAFRLARMENEVAGEALRKMKANILGAVDHECEG